MNTNISNLAIQHQVDIVTSDRLKSMPNFSSTKFSLLYLLCMLPGTIKVGTFHVSQTYFDLKDCISKTIKFINDNCGFIVQGWLKRDIINNRSLLELEPSGSETNHVNLSKINYCFVQILPTNHDSITEGTELFNSLNDLLGMDNSSCLAIVCCKFFSLIVPCWEAVSLLASFVASDSTIVFCVEHVFVRN